MLTVTESTGSRPPFKIAKIDVGPERDWRGGGSHTHLAAHSVTRRKRPWNTFWLAAHSPGRCGTRCCHGSDPQRDRQGGAMTCGMVARSYEIYPPCFTQGDFVVDHAHGVVDLEASQCGSL
jgi:hypothetical protein